MCKFSSKSGGVPFQISFFLGDLTRNDPVSNSFDLLSDTETFSQPFSPNITSPFLPKVHSSPNSIIPPFMSATPLSSTPSIENSASPSSDLPSHDNVNTPTSIPMSPAFDTPDLSSGFSYSKSKKKGNWRTLIINANGVLSKTAEIASIINYCDPDLMLFTVAPSYGTSLFS